jgi:hypothetical protein
MSPRGGTVQRFGIAPIASVAKIYQCKWPGSDGLYRFKWDHGSKTIRSSIAFPGDHGFDTFRGAELAAQEIGFREGNIVPDRRSL